MAQNSSGGMVSRTLGHCRTGGNRDLQRSADLGSTLGQKDHIVPAIFLPWLVCQSGQTSHPAFVDDSPTDLINVPFPGEDSWWVGAAKKNDSTVLPFCDLAMTELQAEDVEMSHTERHRCGSTHLQKDAPNSINLTIDQPMVDGWWLATVSTQPFLVTLGMADDWVYHTDMHRVASVCELFCSINRRKKLSSRVKRFFWSPCCIWPHYHYPLIRNR
jgi:hypothetical protein